MEVHQKQVAGCKLQLSSLQAMGIIRSWSIKRRMHQVWTCHRQDSVAAILDKRADGSLMSR